MSDTQSLAAQQVPSEAVLNAPATAVLGLIAVVVVGALVLVLRALVNRKANCEEEHDRIWHEIDTLRVRSHEQANQLQEALMIARKLERLRERDAEEK